MCKAFTYHGNSVYLLSPFPKTNTKVLRETLNTDHNLTQNIELIFFREWPKNQRISLFLNYFDVKKRIRKVNPDFCFVRNSSFLRACIRNKVLTFYETHNADLHERYGLLNFFLKKRLLVSSKSKYLIKFISINSSKGAFSVFPATVLYS